jgi:hypothetical protein
VLFPLSLSRENPGPGPKSSAIGLAGLDFYPSTQDLFSDEFISSYRGLLILVMQTHLEYQIVTPRTLKGLKSDTLVLPDVGYSVKWSGVNCAHSSPEEAS